MGKINLKPNIKNNEITGKFCAFKNDIPLDEMNIGMGDIFIKMAR